MTSKPRAYSYKRFSTPEQSKGDSLRRQTEKAAAWAVANGYELDRELTPEDRGVSAYHGRNAAEGALAAFLRAVEEERMPRAKMVRRMFERTRHRAGPNAIANDCLGQRKVLASHDDRQDSV
jgi:DNA invertase Pin-like site-specific DNA recombinase